MPVTEQDEALFDPGICHERAVLVAGGSRRLAVFQIFSGKRLWFTVDARVSITGFAVSSSSLYVQDGQVLSGWDLTLGGWFAAVNLVTKKSWLIPADATPATQPPADLYKLPAASEKSSECVALIRSDVARSGG